MTDSRIATRSVSRIVSSCTAVALGACALLSAPTAAQAAGSIKAAYVETVIPAKAYTGSLFLAAVAKTTGPGAGAGVLGISSITLTNFDASPQQVFIFTPIFANPGSDCSGTIIGGTSPQRTVFVQGKSTLHLPFPTPLVVNPVSGLTCIAAEVTTTHTGAVELDFTGFLN
jgi:hypothetical protein